MQTFNYVSLHIISCFIMIEFQCTGLCEIADDSAINYLETSSKTAGTLIVKCIVTRADP